MSLLMQRDLLSLGFLLLAFFVVFALLAVTRKAAPSAAPRRRHPK